MRVIAETFTPMDIIVTECGNVRVTAATARQLDAFYADWREPDMRTREGKLIAQFIKDVRTIALEQWIANDDLLQV